MGYINEDIKLKSKNPDFYFNIIIYMEVGDVNYYESIDSWRTVFKKRLYKIFNVIKERQKGNWNTGYNEYEGQVFIFVNINVAGRTGHDYKNKLSDNMLEWYSKGSHNINSNSIKK